MFQLQPGVHAKLWHITAFLNIECKKYKNLETKFVTTSPGLPYIFILLSKYIRDIRQDIFLRICKYMPHISNSWSKIYSIYRISNFRIYVSCVYDFSMGVWGQSVYQAALRRREIGRNALFSLFLFLLFASFSFLFVGSLSRFY